MNDSKVESTPILMSDLIDSKVHLGHLKRYVSPKMKEFIYSYKDNISVINLDLTYLHIKNAEIINE